MFYSVRDLLLIARVANAFPYLCHMASYTTKTTPRFPLIHELEAIRLLATTEQVKLDVSKLQRTLKEELSITVDEDVALVKSTLLRKLLRKFELSLVVVDENTHPPLFVLRSESVKQPQSGEKLVVNPDPTNQHKSIRLRASIDDHMLSVRLKQAEAFIQAGYVVTITIKSDKGCSTRFSSAISHDKQTIPFVRDSTRGSLTVDTDRFLSVFRKIPGATVLLRKASEGADVILVIRPLGEQRSNKCA